MTLRRTPQLTESIPPGERGVRPSLVDGDRLSGRPDLEVVVEGDASLRRGETRITASRAPIKKLTLSSRGVRPRAAPAAGRARPRAAWLPPKRRAVSPAGWPVPAWAGAGRCAERLDGVAASSARRT